MFEAVTNLVKESRPLQFFLVFFLGGAMAAIFYPTRKVEEKLQKTYQSQISSLQQQHQQELQKVESTYKQQVQELTTTNTQLSSKVTQLTTQVTNLKKHKTTNYYKIVHPDGTVEVRASSDTDTSQEQMISQQVQKEYKQQLETQVTKLEQIQAQKVASLQREWDLKEQSYQSQISTLTKSKTVSTNPKNFSLDVGALSNADYYGHVTYDVWGPFILGLQGQFGPSPAAGAGIGIRF